MASPSGSAPKRRVVTLMTELVAMVDTHLAGRVVSIDTHDFRARVVSTDLDPVDYSVGTALSSGVEASMETLEDIGNAVQRGFEDPNPLRSGARMFDAVARGIDRAIERSPVNPLDGTAELLLPSSAELADIVYGDWRAAEATVTAQGASLILEPERSAVQVSGIEVTARLTTDDVRGLMTHHEVRGADHVVVEGRHALLRRRFGPTTVEVPVEISLDRDSLTVEASTIRLAGRSLKLPNRLRRSETVDLSEIAPAIDLRSVMIDDSMVHVTFGLDDVERPVTAAELRQLIALVSGREHVAIDTVI